MVIVAVAADTLKSGSRLGVCLINPFEAVCLPFSSQPTKYNRNDDLVRFKKHVRKSFDSFSFLTKQGRRHKALMGGGGIFIMIGTQTHLPLKFSFSSDFDHFLFKMLQNAKFQYVLIKKLLKFLYFWRMSPANLSTGDTSPCPAFGAHVFDALIPCPFLHTTTIHDCPICDPCAALPMFQRRRQQLLQRRRATGTSPTRPGPISTRRCRRTRR